MTPPTSCRSATSVLTTSPGRLPATHSQVCNERFDDISATVVCRQLGLPTPGRALGPGYFGSGQGRIWLTGVACSGDEDKLSDCPHNTWGATVSSCAHVKVSCVPGVGKCGCGATPIIGTLFTMPPGVGCRGWAATHDEAPHHCLHHVADKSKTS